MTSINFKKLVLRKERRLIQTIIDAIDSTASIYTCSGQQILGQTDGNPCRYDIIVNEQLLGWVQGHDSAQAIADLLTRLATKELEQRSLAQELLGKYKESSLLFNLSEKILGSLSVREATDVVLTEAQALLKAHSGALYLCQDEVLETIGSFGFGPDTPSAVVVADKNISQRESQAAVNAKAVVNDSTQPDIINTIIKTGRGEIINDFLTDSHGQSSQLAPNALICVPLKNKTSTLGAIALYRSAEHPYAAEDLKLFTTLAGQAAGVIDALLHEEKLQESRQNDLMLRLSSQIHESLELQKILETTVSEIYTALQLDRCLFLWCDTDIASRQLTQQATIPKHSRDLDEELEIVTERKRSDLFSMRSQCAPAAVKQLIENRLCHHQTIRINDVEQLSDDTLRQFLQRQSLTAFFAMPIRTRSGRVGAICCGVSQSSKVWSDSEVALLQAVTIQLGIALDQAELYDQSRIAAQMAQDKAKQLEITIAELQQAQLHLVQSEKMSSIGQMVAGIAHEINNPVSFIFGNLNHLKGYVNDLINLLQQYQKEHTTPSPSLHADIEDTDLPFLLEDLPKMLNSMTIGAHRIREIVLSLRNFSRLDQSDFKTVDIHEGIDSTLLILQHKIKSIDNASSPIKIIKTYGKVPTVDCYPSQLNQVFMNILANGIDAFEASQISKPTITICTQVVDENRLQISITDNGPGIPAHVQKKLFDPFFTTKEVGKGTGLGLSISYQIITERHGGSLVCHSAPGQGTQFVIRIPIQQNAKPSAHT